MNTKTSGQVPSGVALDDRVVLVPPLPEEFDRPLWIATLTAVGGTPKWIAKPGEWVNYGQPLCSFTIHYGALPGFLRIFGTLSKHELIIRSPIHGLVLSGT